jgi:hypothetical protein
MNADKTMGVLIRVHLRLSVANDFHGLSDPDKSEVRVFLESDI